MRRGTTVPLAVRVLRGAAFVALVALFAQSAGVGGNGSDDFFSGWVYDGVIVAGAVLCLLRAVHVRAERAAWGCLALGLLLWAAGEIHWSLSPDSADSTGPGVSDLLWLSFYPMSYAAIVLLVRARLRGASARLWLDGVTAGLGAACL